uniref:Uncharacterized protein n=1 Tax=Candidatus Kentrum sp. LFY TaxID=2126342 RepID=A0A450URV6_9GAMM|nr:MAG: hypothetical protein BECKLFY1418B_GA0070995_106615 [Candidatus Kentron sp. LFY]
MKNRPGMMHSRQTGIGEAIDTGISLLDNLANKPTQILDLVFNDGFLRRILSPHHVGLLAPPGSHGDLSSAIGARGIHILSVLRSSVVTAQLTGRFGKQVNVDIYLCRAKARDTPRLEVFRVVEGLGATDIRTAMPDVLHVAYTPREPVGVAAISEKIVADGFEYVGGGVNHNKLMSEQNAITVLYFRRRQPIEGIPRIELFLAGRHPLPFTAETDHLIAAP